MTFWDQNVDCKHVLSFAHILGTHPKILQCYSRPRKAEAEILMKKRWENAPVRSGAARIVTVALRQSVTLVTTLVVFSVHAGSTGDHWDVDGQRKPEVNALKASILKKSTLCALLEAVIFLLLRAQEKSTNNNDWGNRHTVFGVSVEEEDIYTTLSKQVAPDVLGQCIAIKFHQNFCLDNISTSPIGFLPINEWCPSGHPTPQNNAVKEVDPIQTVVGAPFGLKGSRKSTVTAER
ncbi:hypothetical protein B0H16DRAFT_1475200 [Mycena metata]|uniref:Uncharacterized protein n=1 Tax=Mycena metata TaxID=1033252 RepID=A0AAD7HFM9_9AGAR|nr:hypothetical protein B0H16DRAFT_1475200 [Mycena metata]